LSNMQQTVMQSWQGLNMTMAQLKVLLTLSMKRSAAISKLAHILNVSHPTASQLVDRLVQAGLVERVEDTTDRRVTLARLTEAGTALAQSLWHGRTGHLHDRLAQLDEQDLIALRQGLRALSCIMVQSSSEEPAAEHNPQEKRSPD
ncbi:MAG TPA: MarR family transcriptional regulator, partial [Ktedonobacteraceae bacterium]